MGLLRSLFKLMRATPPSEGAQPKSAEQSTYQLGWYALEEEKIWGDMEDAIGESLDRVKVHVKNRRLIWRRSKKANRSLTLAESITHLHKLHPEYSVEDVQGSLLSWMEECSHPGNVTEEQMEEFDQQLEAWIEEHLNATEDA